MESTKADEIAYALEEEIVSGQIEPGSILRQESLSEQYGVSRTPIREALRRLAALGLVQFVPNRGVRVRTLSREELREAFLVRAELESLATALAVPRFDEEGLADLEAAERRFAELTGELRAHAREGGRTHSAIVGEWVHANHAFHDVIYERANAPYIVRLAKSARRTFFGQTTWAVGSELDDLYVKNQREHSAIRGAIAAGSVDGARSVARDHVLHSGYLLEVILDQVERSPRTTSAA
jgi:DNA-binding GntR family transcriptional regulator